MKFPSFPESKLRTHFCFKRAEQEITKKNNAEKLKRKETLCVSHDIDVTPDTRKSKGGNE